MARLPDILTVLALAVACAAAAPPSDTTKHDPTMGGNQAAKGRIEWHDVTRWGVEGRAWADQERKRWFDRFPAKAEGKVTAAVWSLSRDSAGMMVRFRTDAPAIHARYLTLKPNLAMPHMPATGVSGLDLYARDDSGRWRWVQAVKPTKPDVQAEIVSGLAPGLREYAAYLPLYNGVERLEIGVPPGAKFDGLPPRANKPLVFYGTSITHGASASRPGMVHTAILGRRLDMPVVNLGFSGNGRMDAAVGELLREVDAAAFVIDCLPNMGPADVTAKCAPLVRQLRAKWPSTPIVLVEDRRYTNSWITPAKNRFHDENHAALKAAFDTLVKEGVQNLHYIPGDGLLGDDGDGATDGSHPNDLGFVRQADAMEPVLRKALGRHEQTKTVPDRANPEHQAAAEAVVAEIRKIVIPSINFDDITVEEAFDFLRLRSVELGNDAPDRKGVSMIVKGGLIAGKGTDTGLEAPETAISRTTIAYHAENVDFLTAVREIARRARLDVYLTSSGIVVCGRGVSPLPVGKTEGEEIWKIIHKEP